MVFPNCKFGITVKAIEVPTQKAATRAISADRLLLESDSPKLLPKGGDRALNTPWQYGCTLRLLSRTENGKTGEDTTNENQNAPADMIGDIPSSEEAPMDYMAIGSRDALMDLDIEAKEWKRWRWNHKMTVGQRHQWIPAIS